MAYSDSFFEISAQLIPVLFLAGSDAPIACQAFGEGEFQAAASQAL